MEEENVSSSGRVRKVKGHKDPFEEALQDSSTQPELGEEETIIEKVHSKSKHIKKEEPIEEAEMESQKESEETEGEWNEESDLQDLLHEEGVHEEGIEAEDAMGEENQEENFSEHEHAPEDGLPKKKLPLADATAAHNPLREKLREQLLLKARAHETPESYPAVKLELLEIPEKKIAFIGRKKGVLQKSGMDGALYIGKVQDDEKYGNYSLYLDSLNPHVVFICGSRGSGKCLTGDTLITLENGEVIPIVELEHKEGRILGLQHDLKIQPLYREGFFKRKVEKTLKIHLRSGKEIKLTPEHPLLTVAGWKPVQELEIGSRIATPRSLPSFGNHMLRECEVKIMAYLLAEGHMSNHFVLFSNFDTKIQQEFFTSIDEFHPNLRIVQHSKPGCFRIVQKKKIVDTSTLIRNGAGQFTSEGFILHKKSPIMEWIIANGLYEKKSVHKFIPSVYLQLPKEQLGVFLNRLFSCDGSIYRINKGTNWCIDYSSSSLQLIRQVQHLLLRFGVLSTLRTKNVITNDKNFEVYELVVYGENVLKFISEIGFFGAKQDKADIAIREMTGLKRNPNTDTIPREVWNQFTVNNWAQRGRELGYSSPKSLINSQKYAPSRSKLMQLAQLEQNKGIQLLAQSDIFWDEITEIKEMIGEVEVYDISVPTHHNFIANDIIVHNSYMLGVIAEELALHNQNVGVVVVDPVGVFWSMRFPNKEEREVKTLPEFNLMPQGLENLRVFIPEGGKAETPKNTYDGLFSIPPAMLTSEDWCLTFGMERFSPTGLLLEKALKKVENGFKSVDNVRVEGKKSKYGLDDLILCLEKDTELNSRERGYKPDSIRALVSRFEAAKAWGIFSDKGTPLSEISREGQLTVIDTSFLDDTVTALVIGILARRLLSARKVQTRKEAAQKFKTEDADELLETEIPPTWLFIDEAHTLIPSGNVKTPATNAIVEYVKQGRRPGCSLVFATQQPSAIDTRVLSQLDVIVAHKLIFDDDIKAIMKRTPTIIPLKYKHSNFLKTLPVGIGLTGDRREETSRAFVLRIRPRMSQHEGRDAETGEHKQILNEKDALKLMVGVIYSKLEKEGKMDKEDVDQLVQTLNSKYKSKILLSDVLDELEARGIRIDPKTAQLVSSNYQEIFIPKEKETLSPTQKAHALEQLMQAPEMEKEETGLRALPVSLNNAQLIQRLEKAAKKGLFGFGSSQEKLHEVKLQYNPIYQVEYRQFTGKTSFVQRTCYVDAEKGEFVHFLGNKLVLSKGLQDVADLQKNESKILHLLARKNYSISQISKNADLNEKEIKRALTRLYEKKLITVSGEKENQRIGLSNNVDLPFSSNEHALDSLAPLKLVNVPKIKPVDARVSMEELNTLLSTLWPNTAVTRVSEIYRPIYEATLLNPKTNEYRTLHLDGFTGNIIDE